MIYWMTIAAIIWIAFQIDKRRSNRFDGSDHPENGWSKSLHDASGLLLGVTVGIFLYQLFELPPELFFVMGLCCAVLGRKMDGRSIKQPSRN